MALMKVNKLFWTKVSQGIIIHAVIVWTALALGYNSYKEVMREIDPLTRAVRDSIQGTFPWAIVGFSGLYLISSIRKKNSGVFLNFSRYVYVTIFYAALLNLFCFAKGNDILIPLNLSILYLSVLYIVILLLSNRHLRKVKIYAQDWLPPVLYKHISNSPSKSDGHPKSTASAPFILVFMAAMIIAAILLILDAEKAAEHLANVAYFSVVIGVGIEIYELIKNRNHLNK